MSIENRLLHQFAIRAVEKPARRVIRALQLQTNGLLSGDDSGLENTWDEICAQVQSSQSYWWEAYLEVIDGWALSEADRVPRLEQDAIWLLHPHGEDWSCTQEAETAPQVPVCIEDVGQVIRDRVLEIAGGWSNPAIRRYVESTWRTD